MAKAPSPPCDPSSTRTQMMGPCLAYGGALSGRVLCIGPLQPACATGCACGRPTMNTFCCQGAAITDLVRDVGMQGSGLQENHMAETLHQGKFHTSTQPAERGHHARCAGATEGSAACREERRNSAVRRQGECPPHRRYACERRHSGCGSGSFAG